MMKFFSGFMTGVVVTLLGVLFWLRSDAPSENAIAPASSTEARLPEGFEDFYQQFHEDSIFQISHIVFPLEGIRANADSTDLIDRRFRWQKEDWVVHRPFDDQEGQFDRTYIPLGEDMLIEQIKGVNGQYGMERRFARLSDGWHLIYYAGMNKLLSPEAAEPPLEE